MIDMELTTRIARAADDVWAFITDPANRPKWDRSVISEELTSPGPLAVGSTLHTRMRVLGQNAEFDWRADEVSPPRVLAIASTAGPLATTMRLSLAGVSSATTELTAHLTARPEGMMRVVEPMIDQAIRRDLTAALERLKGLLEA